MQNVATHHLSNLSVFGYYPLIIMLQRLLIVSHVVHYQSDGLLYAYGPYAREIEMWAGLFPEIVIASPLRIQSPPGDALPFRAANISMAPQLETGGKRWFSKAMQLVALPLHLWRLGGAMRSADAIHVRCPGNLGLLGCILAPVFRRPRVAKYAGQWNESENEPLSWRLQKMLLRSKWWNAPVLVYGKWPDQPPHVVSFFTSVMDGSQMAQATEVARYRVLNSFKRILFVGRLTSERNVDVLLRAIRICRDDGVNLSCRIVGDGEMRTRLEQETASLNLRDVVSFAGALPFGQVMEEYANADVLVLVAESEGWGKAIVEGMTFGLVCIGANRGPVPWILAEGRGRVIEPQDAQALARALTQIQSNPEISAKMAQLASCWAKRYSLEGLQDAIRYVLESYWNVTLTPPELKLQSDRSAL